MLKLEDNIFKVEISDIVEIFKNRKRDTNKGDYGTVGIIGGSLEYSGAIKLSNMSATAVRSGCGIVRVIVPEKIAFAIAPYLLEQTIFPIKCDDNNYMIMDNDQFHKAIYGLTAIGVGMGWGIGKDNSKILEKLILSFEGNLVIDADGLNTLSKMDLSILKNSKSKIVLTPHPKEFERLSKISIDEIKKNPVNIAKKFAKDYNIILLLKGSNTIITDGNKTFVADRGCSGMATAGSGDVLSGILVGLLGYEDVNILNISAGAFLAGVAGEFAQEKYTDISMKASDTIEFIPEAIKYIRNSLH